MEIERLLNDEGKFRCFQVNNQKVSRNGMAKMLSNFPGIEINHWPKFYDDEVFCEFLYNGFKFEILEPYGDNTTYDLVAPEGAQTELEEIAKYFEESKAIKGGDLGHAAFFISSWLIQSVILVGIIYGIVQVFKYAFS